MIVKYHIPLSYIHIQTMCHLSYPLIGRQNRVQKLDGSYYLIHINSRRKPVVLQVSNTLEPYPFIYWKDYDQH